MVQKIVVVGHSGLAAVLGCQQAQLIAAPDEMSLRDAVSAAVADGTQPAGIGLVFPWDIIENAAGVGQQLMSLGYRVVVVVDDPAVDLMAFGGVPVAGSDSTVDSLAMLLTQVMGVMVFDAEVGAAPQPQPQYEAPAPQYEAPQFEQPQYEPVQPQYAPDPYAAPQPQTPQYEQPQYVADPYAAPQPPAPSYDPPFANEPVIAEPEEDTPWNEPWAPPSQPQPQYEAQYEPMQPQYEAPLPQQDPFGVPPQQFPPVVEIPEVTPDPYAAPAQPDPFGYASSPQSPYETPQAPQPQDPFAPPVGPAPVPQPDPFGAPPQPAPAPVQDPFAPPMPQAPQPQVQDPFSPPVAPAQPDPYAQPMPSPGFAQPQHEQPYETPQAPQPQDPFAPPVGPAPVPQPDPFGAPPQPAPAPVQDPFAPPMPPPGDPFGSPPAPSQPDPYAVPPAPPVPPAPQPDPFAQPPAPVTPSMPSYQPDPYAAPPQQPVGDPYGAPPASPQADPYAQQPAQQYQPDPFAQPPVPAPMQQPDPFAAPSRPTPPPVPQDPFAQSAVGMSSPGYGGGHGPSADFSGSQQAPQRIRKAQVHTFAVPKGGTGKSSLAAIYAAVMSQGLRMGLDDDEPGPRVLLIDANVQQADSRRIMGLRPQRTILDLARTVFDENTIESYLTPPSPANPMWLLAGPLNKAEADPQLITPALYRRVTDLLLPRFDHIVIDTPEARLYDPMLADYAMPITDWLIVPVLQNRPVLDGTKEWLQLIQAPRHVGGYAFDPSKVRIVMNMVRDAVGYKPEALSVDLAAWEFAGQVAYSDEVARATNEYRLPLNDKPLVDSVRNVLHSVTGNPVFGAVQADMGKNKRSKGGKNAGNVGGFIKKMMS